MGTVCYILFIVAIMVHQADQTANPIVHRRLVRGLGRTSLAFGAGNVFFGVLSRSLICNALSRQMRGEDASQLVESLNQAIVTLAVLDLGGGVLAPIAEDLIAFITTKPAFQNVRRAMIEYGTPLLESLDDFRSVDQTEFLEAKKAQLTRDLRIRRSRVTELFEIDVQSMGRTNRALRYLKKAKRWLGVRNAGKVLGPLFDVVSIGVNGWALGTAIRTCVDSPDDCSPESLASASLSIASGLVGVGTFAATLFVSAGTASVLGPVGAVAGLTLAIVATLIELFSGASGEEIARERNENLMRELDRISRLQLFRVNKFLTDFKGNRNDHDLYVVNQGHLPTYFHQHPRVVKFGKIASNQPRKKIIKAHSCEEPIFGDHDSSTPCCPYLVDGQRLTQTHGDQSLGYGFYGFTPTDKTLTLESQCSTDGVVHQDSSPYQGAIVLVNTDQVAHMRLAQVRFSASRSRSIADWKGLDIDTSTKSGGDAPFDDLVVIGDYNALEPSERIKVRTGSGNDALNIDGAIGFAGYSDTLDADLGVTGHNMLSFKAMSWTYTFVGMNFSAKTGVLRFKTTNYYETQRVGTVRNVQTLIASPFTDRIEIYASKPGSEGFDFTVFKFKGHGTYEVNIKDHQVQDQVRHYKIVDNEECGDNHPLLLLTDFPNTAFPNDVLYQDNRILVYGHRTNVDKRSHVNSTSATAGTEEKSQKRYTYCTAAAGHGSSGGRYYMGGTDGKALLATIAFYTKCPGMVGAKFIGGTNMFMPRRKAELDIKFSMGMKLIVDGFSPRAFGTECNDHCPIKCPQPSLYNTQHQTTIDFLGGTEDTLILTGELFLDPCNIDGDHVNVAMQRGSNDDEWYLDVVGHENFPNGFRYILRGVNQVVNEYGDVLTAIDSTTENIDIYDLYSHATMGRAADIMGDERTSEVKDNLLQCMKLPSDMTDEERQLCREE